LAAGNTVVAKPAEQTPAIAFEAVKLFHAAGLPVEALHLLTGDGTVGGMLTGDARCGGVAFTGSTEVARIINQAVAVAAGIGATPIPFADAALLVPNQVTMIARITAAYGLPPSTSRAMATAGSVILTGGATMAGRYAVTSLLKLVPGGVIAGSAISATVAGSLTKAVGMAWSRVCEYALTMDPTSRQAFLTGPEVSRAFLGFLKTSKLR
jgi:uncharacterized protein (DUF697 family)